MKLQMQDEFAIMRYKVTSCLLSLFFFYSGSGNHPR